MTAIKRIFLSAALLLGATQAQAVELRLAHWVPATHPVQKFSIEPWIESIRRASHGRIKITVFPAQKLGPAADHYDMTVHGVADIGYVNPGYQAGRFPILSLVELPFHASNAKRGARAMHEWYLDYAETEMPEVKLCLLNPHNPGTLHSKMQIKVPSDVHGLTVRPANATIGDFIQMIGGSSIQVAAPDARKAIATGAADAITFPWNSMYVFGIDKETRYHLDMPLYQSLLALVINKRTYNGLEAPDRDVIDAHCTPEWSETFSSGWADTDVRGRQRMIGSGEHIVYVPTAEEEQVWRDAAAPLLDKWKAAAREAGIDADKAYADYVARLKANESLFD